MAPTRDVILNVYDIASPQDPTLISNINNWLVLGGLGVFHSGVEIDGVEYCFGGHPESSTGVFEVSPRTAPDALFREAIMMGRSSLDRRAVADLVHTISDAWPGNSYDLLDRNCNSFANDLCVALVGTAIPAWVNRLAYIGSRARWLLPKELEGATAAAAAEANSAPAPPLTSYERIEAAEARAIAAEVRAAAFAAGIDVNSGEDVDLDGQGRQAR
jgi:deubiquitinase DESI2